jgi:hypothetical protein
MILILIILVIIILYLVIDYKKDTERDVLYHQLEIKTNSQIAPSPVMPQLIKIQTDQNIPPNRLYNSKNNFQQIGFIYNSTNRYPLFSRNKYPNKSDKQEYYIIDDKQIKIPFSSKNDNELFNSDTVIIPELNNQEFKVQVYEIDTTKYDPNF